MLASETNLLGREPWQTLPAHKQHDDRCRCRCSHHQVCCCVLVSACDSYFSRACALTTISRPPRSGVGSGIRTTRLQFPVSGVNTTRSVSVSRSLPLRLAYRGPHLALAYLLNMAKHLAPRLRTTPSCRSVCLAGLSRYPNRCACSLCN